MEKKTMVKILIIIALAATMLVTAIIINSANAELVPIKDVDDPFPHYTKGTVETITHQGEITFIKLKGNEYYHKFTEDKEFLNSIEPGDKISIHYANSSKLFKNSDIR